MNERCNIWRGLFGRRILPLLLAMLLLTGCATTPPEENTAPVTEATETTVPVEETEPPTAPPDGDPENVTCKGSYTVTDEEAAAAADAVVATVGEAELTNRMLRIYYWMEVAEYLARNPETKFEQPLDTLLCDLDDTAVTWQQYFLRRALNTWHSHQALYQRAADTDLPTEEAYDRSEDYHAVNINADMPAVEYLYGYVHENFQPNEMHRAYMDGLPALLEELAAANGFENLEAQLLDLAGAGTDAAALVAYAQLYNWVYAYYTQLTYDMAFTAEETDAFYLEHQAAYEAEDITPESGSYVTIRQILLVPEGAEVAADGTVTADEEAWEACRVAAEDLLALWRKNLSHAKKYSRRERMEETLFAELAHAHSADAGSSLHGGLYSGLYRGQLIEELDTWSFDPKRKNGDIAVIRSTRGYHLVFFVGSEDILTARVEADMISQNSRELLRVTMEEYPMAVDYSAISLGLAERRGGAILADQLLYPDIAHERYPSAPLYLQQDYPYTLYGGRPIGSCGCGITTMAMLASYMMDEEYTPPELARIYGYYLTDHGSDFSMFERIPSEVGFFLIHRTSDWDEVVAALEEGKMVVSLQKQGYWTRGGHFILLQDVTEEGLIEVRDSNLFNYGSLSGHQIDAHEPAVITPKSFGYWIYEPKAVRTPMCARCGEVTGENPVSVILLEGYCCDRCDDAVARRNDFVDACESVK